MPAMKALDIEAVQAFVLVAELKSFTRAAEALASTQSAVSLKIKRLEDHLGRRLLERTPRLVRLSADGGVFLEAARGLVAAHRQALGAFAGGQPRRLVVGISHHIVGAELPGLLRQLTRAEPGLLLELRVDSSRETLERFDRGELDVALVLQQGPPRQDAEVVMQEPFAWMGAADFQPLPGQPLPLATQAEPCSVRRMAVDALDQAGVAWREVFVGGGLMTIGAAVSAGIAVAALGRRVAPAGCEDVGGRLGLPALPGRDVLLFSHPRDAQARGMLRTLVAAVRSTVG
ncbi:LysR family transcriptional regulator [Pseudomonas citronellolis]|uniref:LysR family transcriptional regulator n=1 Tax=Pseudomonas citronellolis TaxID=53408 RepID=UPI00192CF2F5|nr:LysR substrate-binding domain-containing protein [Pseudomonas humi]